MLILKPWQKRLKKVHQNRMNHTVKHIRNTQIVHMVMKLSVVMTTDLANLYKYTENIVHEFMENMIEEVEDC